jgi:hypothetical protein
MLARVSNIETYRRWRDWQPLNDESVEPTVDETVNEIIAKEPTEAMRAGTAFHAAIERADFGEHDRFFADGYGFVLPDAEIALSPIREVRTYRGYCDITVTGKADSINGRHIIDHKTTETFHPDWYLAGCQWRFYLELFGADTFTWYIYELKEDGPKSYRVKAPHVLTMHRYPEIAADCELLAAEYLEFARLHLPADFDPLASERLAA